MADWSDKDYCLGKIENYYKESLNATGRADTHWSDAWKEIYWEFDQWAFNIAILDCVSDVIQAVKQLQGYWSSQDPKWAVPYFLEHHALTDWKSIAEAWAYNNFEGRDWTIACIDRMRQLLWDEPFSIVWAAKPENTILEI